MHKIYFEQRCLVICSREEARTAGAAGEVIEISGPMDAASVTGSFKSGSAGEIVYVTGEDTERISSLLYGQFKEVNAAGGLVEDGSGRVLLIRRNSMWDIPKGHQEEGEDIRTTALREVEEETGISGLTEGDLICVTDHCYLREGIWHLKHTWWYRMTFSGEVNLTPQVEEGITETVWVERSEALALAGESYPSIQEVLESALGIL